MMVSKSNEKEMESILKELDHYGVGHDVIAPDMIFSRRGRFVELFQLDAHTSNLLGHLKDFPFDPVYMGLKLGEVSKGRFRPSLEFGSMIIHRARLNTVALGDDHAQMFLYGRDIFKENLPTGLSLGRKLVGDKDGGFLGYGIFNGRYLANIIDKGAYIRKYD